MKRVVALVIFGVLTGGFWNISQAQIDTNQTQSKPVIVSATVSSVSVSVTGYQSPNASIIVKTKEGVFLTSLTADTNGYFSLSDLLVNSSERTLCFQAVDFKRIGLSESCITFPGAITDGVTYDDIFLPPTIGLSKKIINAGQDALIYGYSMPGATVTLYIDGKAIEVTADEAGYYTYTYENVPAGEFRITAEANLDGQESLNPTNDVLLQALSIPQQITTITEETAEEIGEKVPLNLLPFFLMALAFLVAIGILLYKLKFKLWMIFIDFLFKKKKMHHDWFLDKW